MYRSLLDFLIYEENCFSFLAVFELSFVHGFAKKDAMAHSFFFL